MRTPAILLLLLLGAFARADVSIEIDLTAQKAWLLQDGERIYESPISSGRASHATPTGNFAVTEKDLDHRSSLYGRIVAANGRTLVSDADSGMARPAGAKFVQAPMKYFIRFDGAIGLHAGHLPGYPASHGCIRLPPKKAALFFDVVTVGTPVRVFGKAAYRAAPERSPAPVIIAAAATPIPKKSWLPWIKRVGP